MKHKGVAITTTPEKIIKAFTPYRIKPDYGEEQLYGGTIKYTDLSSVRLNTSMLETFYHKHMAFEWEKEFRLAISLRIAEECGVNVPEKGIHVHVNLQELIDRIVLGPKLTEEEMKNITTKAKNVGISDKVEISTLLYTPKYI